MIYFSSLISFAGRSSHADTHKVSVINFYAYFKWYYALSEHTWKLLVMTLSNLYPVYAQVVSLIYGNYNIFCWIYWWGDSIMADKGFIFKTFYIMVLIFTIDVNHFSWVKDNIIGCAASRSCAVQNKQTFIWWGYLLSQHWRVAKTQYPFQKSSD